MQYSRSILALSVILLFTLSAFTTDEVDISGKWNISVQMAGHGGEGGERPAGRRGPGAFQFEFIQEGEKLTVLTNDRDGNEIKTEGTIEGDEIKWELERETPMGKMTLKYDGKIIDEDNMEGEVQFGEFRTAKWIARRVIDETEK